MYKTEEEIKENMLKKISNTVDKTQNSLIHDAVSPACIEIANFYLQLEKISEKLNIENLTENELDQFVYSRTGLKRKLASRASTKVIISGQDGTKIKKGDLVSSDSVNFYSIEEKTIGESGFIEIIVECEELGTIGNVQKNAINSFPVLLPGVIDVYNPENVCNGYDSETDNELRNRYYEKLQKPAKAGNKYHYEQWAMEVIGVGGVKVIPRWNGPLTVKVIIIDKNGLIANEELIDETLMHIENNRPFGADITVVSATAKIINIEVTLVLAEEYLESEVKDSIKENIESYLKSIAFKSDYISYAAIGKIILDTRGVLDYSNLLMNDVTSNIPIANDEVAIIGGVS